jgi:hypothetical protein
MVQGADNVDGKAGADEVKFDFAVSSADQTVATQLSNTGIVKVETMTFDVPKANSEYAPVQCSDVGYEDITTVNLGKGDDKVTAGLDRYNDIDPSTAGVQTGATERYNLGGGDDTFISAENTDTGTLPPPVPFPTAKGIVDGGAGDDTFHFAQNALGDAGDAIYGGEGLDRLIVNGSQATDYPVSADTAYDPMALADIKSVENFEFHADHKDDGFVITDRTIEQSDEKVSFDMYAIEKASPGNSVFMDASGATKAIDATIHWKGISSYSVTLKPDVVLGSGDDNIVVDRVSGSCIVAGGRGADRITISEKVDGTLQTGVGVEFLSELDGGMPGKAEGYDTIVGYTPIDDISLSGDFFGFSRQSFKNIDKIGTGFNQLVSSYDAGADFMNSHNAMVITRNYGGLDDEDLLDMESIADTANAFGVVASTGWGGIIVAQGLEKSAIYLYIESEGAQNHIDEGDFRLLAIVDSNEVGDDRDGDGDADDLGFSL